jgi:hypothetical protein
MVPAMERRLAAILVAVMGDMDAAHGNREKLLAACPDFTVENWALT